MIDAISNLDDLLARLVRFASHKVDGRSLRRPIRRTGPDWRSAPELWPGFGEEPQWKID